MTADKIMALVRLAVGDSGKTKISDWQIIEAMNDGMRILGGENAKKRGSLFRSSASLDFSTADTVTLPALYITPIKVFDSDGAEMLRVFNDTPSEGEYSIAEGSMECGNDETVTLRYFSTPAVVTSGSSTINIPDTYMQPIAKITAAVLAGNYELAIGIAARFLQDGTIVVTGGDKK